MATQNYDRRVSGAGLFAVRLAEALAERGHEVLVAAPSDVGPGYRTSRGGVRIEFARSLTLRPFTSKIRLGLPGPRWFDRLFAEFEPEVVHSQDHYPIGRAAILTARRESVPVLATNHFLPENMLPYMPFPKSWHPAASRLLWRWAVRTFDRADLVSAPSRAGVVGLRRAGLHTEARAVSCGVDRQFFRPLSSVDRAGILADLGLRPEVTTLLFVGRLDREKRLDLVLAALVGSSADGPQLILVGSGVDESRFRRQALRLGLAGRVAFTGYVSRRKLLELMNAADIFVMPSGAELLSIATLEAMAVGKPVLAADAWALPELVTPGVNGELFRSGDQADLARNLDRLCERSADWPAMAEASRAVAAEHDFGVVVSTYEGLYRDLMEAGLVRGHNAG